MTTLDQFANEKLARLEAGSLRRWLRPTARSAGAVLERDGRRLISFSCNDYLNLSTHPAVIEAAVAAARRYGAGAGASRLVTGDHPLYRTLEDRLAMLKGTEDAVVFGSGFLANSGIIPALMTRHDAIFIDDLAHACIWAGSRLSGATIHAFRRNDLAHLAGLLAEHRGTARHALIATDGVFSMDGDLAPVGEMLALAQKQGAWLMTGDAHGIGVMNCGRGAAHGHAVPLQMGTLSKAVGSYGGYLCASHAVCELTRNRARSFVYTTGLPPSVVGASLAALNLIANNPTLCAAPVANARRFSNALRLGPAESPIVPLLLGTAERALEAQAALETAGFLVAAIRPPTVPEGTARLRFAFTADHRPDDIDRLAQLVREKILVVT